MSTRYYIQVPNTFTIMELIAESTPKRINNIRNKVFGNLIFEMKVVTSSGLIFKCFCNLQQLRMFFSDFFNLALVCKDNEPRHGRTRTKASFLLL